MGAMGRCRQSLIAPMGRSYKSHPSRNRAKTATLLPMILRASLHCVSADLGWRWWPLAAVAPVPSFAKEMPRDSARSTTATVPAIRR